ncbi:hypothetical protein [Petrachloros mirabilis]
MPISTQPLSKPAEKMCQSPLQRCGLTGKEEVEEKRRMVRLTVTLPSDLVEQMRDAVYWTPGVTLAWVIGRALQSGLVELVTANHGPFPKRAKPLRAGRPKLLGQSMAISPPSPHRTGVLPANDSPQPIHT